MTESIDVGDKPAVTTHPCPGCGQDAPGHLFACRACIAKLPLKLCRRANRAWRLGITDAATQAATQHLAHTRSSTVETSAGNTAEAAVAAFAAFVANVPDDAAFAAGFTAADPADGAYATGAQFRTVVAELAQMRRLLGLGVDRDAWDVIAEAEGRRYEGEQTNDTIVGWLAYERESARANNHVLLQVERDLRAERDQLRAELERLGRDYSMLYGALKAAADWNEAVEQLRNAPVPDSTAALQAIERAAADLAARDEQPGPGRVRDEQDGAQRPVHDETTAHFLHLANRTHLNYVPTDDEQEGQR